MAYTPERLAEALRKAHGDDLRAVILYGSGAAGDRHPRYSDLNVLVVLRETGAGALAVAGPALRKWERAGNPAPLFMTPEFLARSADAFPLEWLDMKEQRRVLAGEDVLAPLAVDPRHLRIELERELKGALLRLRGAYAAAAGDARRTRELLIRSSSTFLVLFRGALRRLGAAALPPKADAARALGSRLGVDVEAFEYVRRLKARERPARREPVGPWAERYLATVDRVVERIDAET